MKKGAAATSIESWQKKIATRFDSEPRYMIPALQYVQSEEGYLPPEAMSAVARHLRVSEAKVFGVASFYSLFHFEPRGRHTITVCRGTACHVRGSAGLLAGLEKKLGVKAGGTTGDLEFSLDTVACFGSCALAPVVVADARVYGRQSEPAAVGLVDGLRNSAPDGATKKNKTSKKATASRTRAARRGK